MDTLDALLRNPLTLPALVAVLTTLIVAGLRAWRPDVWAKLPERVQVLPALLVSALLSGGAMKLKAEVLAQIGTDLLPVLQEWAVTAVSGWLGAMGTHQVTKRVGSLPGAKTLSSMLVCLSLFGCSGSFEEARAPHLKVGAPPASERCVELDDRHAVSGTVAATSGALAGVSGLAALPLVQKSEEWELGLALSGASFGAIAAGAAWLSADAATAWARECSVR